jgi:hypothetical protein
MAFLNELLGGLVNTQNVRDAAHADRTFHSNNYYLFPKTKRWFHVCFDMTPEAVSKVKTVMDSLNYEFQSKIISNMSATSTLSVLVKNSTLPGYKFETKKYNQYNKQTIGVHKVTYEPISIEFHDDSSDFIRSFWFAYYQYMVQDTRYTTYAKAPPAIPSQWHRNDDRELSNLYNVSDEIRKSSFGLDTVNNKSNLGGFNKSSTFFNAIRIYQFSRPVADRKQANFIEYVLVNPVITGFKHEQFDYSSNESSSHKMDIEYETVLYNGGYFNDNESNIPTWDEVQKTYYDNRSSPLKTNPTTSVFGNNGLLNSIGTLGSALTGGGISAVGVLSAGLQIGRTVNTWNSAGGVDAVLSSLNNEGRTIANQAISSTITDAVTGGIKTVAVPNVKEVISTNAGVTSMKTLFTK